MIVDHFGNIWATLYDCVLKFDGSEWTIYKTSNTGVYLAEVTCLAEDDSGNIWIGTRSGLRKFDGTFWYNTASGGDISCITHDHLGNIWISNLGGGLEKFNGISSTVYDTSNSPIPSMDVTCCSVDSDNNIWCGTAYNGLVKFDGINWKLFTSSNSELPCDEISSIYCDSEGIHWVGTGGHFFYNYYAKVGKGLIRFDGINWTQYNTSNSALPFNSVPIMVFDESDNLLIDVETPPSHGSGYFGIGYCALLEKKDNRWQMVSELSDSAFVYTSLAIDKSNSKWIGTDRGVLKLNGSELTTFNTSNSPTRVTCCSVDSAGQIWCGTTFDGLVKFDEISWKAFTTSNSGLPSNNIQCIAIDFVNNIWIGTEYGLTKYDGTNWTLFDRSKSGLPSDFIRCLAIGIKDNVWIGTGNGVVKYEGSKWQIYDSSNSGLPSDVISCIATDNYDNVWIGTNNGVVKFNGKEWTSYNSSNSGLPDDNVYSLAFDKKGNKWIGTENGLAVYNEDGITSIEEPGNIITIFPNQFYLSQNYPNPFNPTTKIKYSIPNSSFVTLKVFDILGREIETLINEEKTAGNYEIDFDASQLSSGIYFYQLKSGEFIQTKKMILIR